MRPPRLCRSRAEKKWDLVSIFGNVALFLQPFERLFRGSAGSIALQAGRDGMS